MSEEVVIKLVGMVYKETGIVEVYTLDGDYLGDVEIFEDEDD